MAKAQADRIVHKAAWLYYTHGLRQDEVAQRLNISRASVALYLRRARESGVVTISTATHLFKGEQLSRRLEDVHGLESAWVVGEDGGGAGEEAEIPILAASVFLEMVGRGQRVGIAWGRTVYSIADAMAFADLQGVTVVQLCGNLGSPYSYRPDQCTMEIARRLNAQGLNFYAPLVLSTRELADALRREPVVREQLDSVAGCDLSLYSVGTLDEDSHVVKCGALALPELARLKAQGAVGVIAGQMIDRDGQLLDCDYNRRVISADLASLRAIPRRLLVVQEAIKLEPLRAALAGGFCTHLITTSTIARQLALP